MKIPKKKFGDPIEITWVDAFTKGGWVTRNEAEHIDDYPLCFSRGWFIVKKNGFIVMALTKGKNINDDVMNTLSIPDKWIRSIK